MADEKVYEPEIVSETPFPEEVVQSVSQTQGSGDTVTPTTTKDKSFPTRKIAHELMSTALNTKSKKILQEFELTQSGAIRIGNYKEGVSGEVLITADGIVTKDKAGLTTIAIYGDDGSGVFKGSIQAGSLITGSVEITDGDLRMYNNGILEIFMGDDGT